MLADGISSGQMIMSDMATLCVIGHLRTECKNFGTATEKGTEPVSYSLWRMSMFWNASELVSEGTGGCHEDLQLGP